MSRAKQWVAPTVATAHLARRVTSACVRCRWLVQHYAHARSAFLTSAEAAPLGASGFEYTVAVRRLGSRAAPRETCIARPPRHSAGVALRCAVLPQGRCHASRRGVGCGPGGVIRFQCTAEGATETAVLGHCGFGGGAPGVAMQCTLLRRVVLLSRWAVLCHAGTDIEGFERRPSDRIGLLPVGR